MAPGNNQDKFSQIKEAIRLTDAERATKGRAFLVREGIIKEEGACL